MCLQIRAGKRHGTSVIEVALVSFLFLLFMLAIFEYGRFLMVRQMVDNAAREACRLAVSGTNTYTTAQIQQTAVGYLGGQPLLNTSGQVLSASDIQVFQANPATGQPASPDSLWTDAPFGVTIAVQIQAVYQPMLPHFGFLPTSVPLNTTVMMQSEAN